METEIQHGKEITVEKWLQKMWLPQGTRHGHQLKPRRALTVVRKKQGVACLLVEEKDEWDTCTKLAEDKESGESIMAYYRRIVNLQDKVAPGKDRVMVIPTEAWQKMTSNNLFIGQFEKDKSNELDAEIQGETDQGTGKN